VSGGAEAVQDLHVLVAYQQALGHRAFDLIEEGLLETVEDIGGGGTILRLDLQRDFKTGHEAVLELGESGVALLDRAAG
jgi:hypothetical protein